MTKKKVDNKQIKNDKSEKKDELDKLYGFDTSQVNGTITIEVRSAMTMKVGGKEYPSPVNYRVLDMTGNIPSSVGIIHSILVGASRAILNTEVPVANKEK